MDNEDFILELDKELRRKELSTYGVSSDDKFIYKESFFSLKLFFVMFATNIIIYLIGFDFPNERQEMFHNIFLLFSPFALLVNSLLNKHDKGYLSKDIFINVLGNITVTYVITLIYILLLVGIGLLAVKLSLFFVVFDVVISLFITAIIFLSYKNYNIFSKSRNEIKMVKKETEKTVISNKYQERLLNMNNLKEVLILDIKAKKSVEYRASQDITNRLKNLLREKNFKSLDEYILALAVNDENDNENEILIEVS